MICSILLIPCSSRALPATTSDQRLGYKSQKSWNNSRNAAKSCFSNFSHQTSYRTVFTANQNFFYRQIGVSLLRQCEVFATCRNDFQEIKYHFTKIQIQKNAETSSFFCKSTSKAVPGKKNPMNGALSLCLIQCRIIHRASCQMIQDELTKIHRNKDLGAHSGKLNSHILCSQLNNIIRKNGFSWDACSNLGVIHIPGFQEIRLENTWRSPSKPEKIWSLRPSAQIGNWIVCPQH